MIIIAIIIPFFKKEFFKDTLDGLVSQTNQNFNVYIGNDDSPDDVENLIDDYSDRLNLKYIRFESNLGSIDLVGHWERCLQMMENETWFMILGDDDVLSNNVIECFYEKYEEFSIKNSVVRFASQVIDSCNNKVSCVFNHPIFENSIDSYIRKLNGLNRSSLSEYVFKRDLYEEKGFKHYDFAWTTDDRAVIDISNLNDVYTINNALVYFRISDSHISSRLTDLSTKRIVKIESLLDLINDYRSIMKYNQKERILQITEFEILNNSNLSLKVIFRLIKEMIYAKKIRNIFIVLNVLIKFKINGKKGII